jgi:SAM-dependent methyltransferase
VTATPETLAPQNFDAALAGTATTLELADGRTVRLRPARWHADPDHADRWLLDRCHGATIDLGCGPGRLVKALVDQGTIALGVDTSTRAIGHCASRGAPVLHRDLFRPLPGEGRWRHVLLADGNIGIGGDPTALLCRAAALLGHDGSVLVETAPPATGLWTGGGRLRESTGAGPWFPWAVVGLDAVAALAHTAGLRPRTTHRDRHRYFAELVRSGN